MGLAKLKEFSKNFLPSLQPTREIDIMLAMKRTHRIEIHSKDEICFNGGDFRAATIGQLLQIGCKIVVYEYEREEEEPTVVVVGGDKNVLIPTPVARDKPREKRKYEPKCDEEREMQIQMGALYYIGRRNYDHDGKKGIKVSYNSAARVILKFFDEVLPVQVKLPSCEGIGGNSVKEEAIGYLRLKNGDSALKDLAKAIARRVKKGRDYIL